MPVGFARSLFTGSVFIPKETVITISGISSSITGLFFAKNFNTSKDELGIVGSTVGDVNGRALIIADGTYNMQITGSSGTSIGTSLGGGGLSASAQIGKGPFTTNFGNGSVSGNFNLSKTYSGSGSSPVQLNDVVLPYNFGTVTFNGDRLTVKSGLSTESGNTQSTPSWTITLYEIAS